MPMVAVTKKTQNEPEWPQQTGTALVYIAE
jgi:hypothetical protein